MDCLVVFFLRIMNNNRHRGIWLSLWLVITAITIVESALSNVYVSSSAEVDSTTCTIGAPCTIAAFAADSLGYRDAFCFLGATMWLDSGTYTFTDFCPEAMGLRITGADWDGNVTWTADTAAPQNRVITFSGGSTRYVLPDFVTLKGVRVSGTAITGGVFFIASSPSATTGIVEDCQFHTNTGPIFNMSSQSHMSLEITRCHFVDNTQTASTASILQLDDDTSDVMWTDIVVDEDESPTDARAVHCTLGSMDFDNTTLCGPIMSCTEACSCTDPFTLIESGECLSTYTCTEGACGMLVCYLEYCVFSHYVVC